MFNQITNINLNFILSDVRDQIFLPDEIILYQNYPNPFNPSTTINFSIFSQSFVSLKVYDILGNEVAILLNEVMPAGNYEVAFNSKNLPNVKTTLPSGVYLYKLTAGGNSQTKKMILLK